MLKSHLVLPVALVFALLLLLTANSANQASGKPNVAAPVVEYKVHAFSSSGYDNEESMKNHTRRLNALAKAGWQYAFVVTENSRELIGKGIVRKATFVAFQRTRRP